MLHLRSTQEPAVGPVARADQREREDDGEGVESMSWYRGARWASIRAGFYLPYWTFGITLTFWWAGGKLLLMVGPVSAFVRLGRLRESTIMRGESSI